MTEDRRVRVLLADGQALFREAVRIVLMSQDEFDVVAEADDAAHALSEAERSQPDVALVDSDLPGGDGIRVTSQVAERVPSCRVIVLSGQDDEQVMLAALEAGAVGYLSKQAPLAELMEATRAVSRGDVLVPPRMLGTVLKRLIHRRREHDEALRKLGTLTRREREILGLLANGAGSDEIARRLVISPETSRTHIQNLLGKLQVHSRLEAVAFVTANDVLGELVGVEG